jgi:glycosyltransferase involved in cell wall biosynthesis
MPQSDFSLNSEEIMKKPIDLQVILPVHNEADSIEKTIREIYREISSKVVMEFIVCEDGSVDNTKAILNQLSTEFPIKLIMSNERKGYSKAVKDGMKAMDARYLLCLDSDGQCDPHDFWKFWDSRDQYDVLIGWRTKRADPGLRKILSRFFYLVYKLFFNVPSHDPSCPFVLARKDVIESLADEMERMQQGFWWEFTARAYLHGFKIKEIRLRFAGKTQVYHLKKMPGIGLRHFLALFQIRFQTKK